MSSSLRSFKSSYVITILVFLSVQVIFHLPSSMKQYFVQVDFIEDEISPSASSTHHNPHNSNVPGTNLNTTRFDTSYKNNISFTVRESKQQTSSPIIRFVPFPHRDIGIGDLAQCNWSTFERKKNYNNDDDDDKIVRSLLGINNRNQQASEVTLDLIQKAALRDGICVTSGMRRYSTFVNEESSPPIHLFSINEARKCLENVKLAVAGDSYNKHLFLGLYDVVRGSNSNLEATNSDKRTKKVQYATKKLKQLRQNNTNETVPIPDLYYKCESTCYGSVVPFSRLCSQCLLEFAQQIQNSTPSKPLISVVGAGVHILQNVHSVNNTILEMFQFADSMPNGVIFNSMPSYQLSKVPEPYKAASKWRQSIYTRMVPMVLNHSHTMRFLDFFQLTDSCDWHNCSVDGGHRARFVNRWKAQLVLNTLCEYIPSQT